MYEYLNFSVMPLDNLISSPERKLQIKQAEIAIEKSVDRDRLDTVCILIM